MSEDVVRVEPPDALRPAGAASTARLVLPQLIVDAGPVAVARFLEFFAARIANRRTRAAYGRAVGFLYCFLPNSPDRVVTGRRGSACNTLPATRALSAIRRGKAAFWSAHAAPGHQQRHRCCSSWPG